MHHVTFTLLTKAAGFGGTATLGCARRFHFERNMDQALPNHRAVCESLCMERFKQQGRMNQNRAGGVWLTRTAVIALADSFSGNFVSLDPSLEQEFERGSPIRPH